MTWRSSHGLRRAHRTGSQIPGLSQAEVARRLEWSPPNYARIEKGRTTPSLKSMEAIAEALEVPISALTQEVFARGGSGGGFASAGPGVEFTDQGYPAGGGMYFLPRPPQFTDPNGFGVEVAGDSMVPKYEDGQVVMVDTRKRPCQRRLRRHRPHGRGQVREALPGVRRHGRPRVREPALPPPVVVEPSEVRFAYKIVWVRER